MHDTRLHESGPGGQDNQLVGGHRLRLLDGDGPLGARPRREGERCEVGLFESLAQGRHRIDPGNQNLDSGSDVHDSSFGRHPHDGGGPAQDFRGERFVESDQHVTRVVGIVPRSCPFESRGLVDVVGSELYVCVGSAFVGLLVVADRVLDEECEV